MLGVLDFVFKKFFKSQIQIQTFPLETGLKTTSPNIALWETN